MKDIKFRGLSKITGKFVYGNLIQTSEYKDGHIHCWIQEKSLLGLGALSTPTTNFIEVHSESVGQFTGLQDKNGVDIYEGDILSTKMIDNSIHKVVIRYSNKYSRFVYCPLSEKWDFDRCVVDNPYERKNYQIIANIHQNPELLETK